MDAKIIYEGREVTFFDVDEKSHIGNCLLNVCWYELKNLEVIRSLDVQGNYVDAGAHIGTHALFFSLFCPAKRVYAFESKHEYYLKLLKNINGNHVKNCLPFNYALVGERGEQMNPDEGETFKTETLDHFNLENVKLLKIDVENMELRVLKGAVRTLKTVEHLFLEVWTDEVYAKRGETSPMAEIVSFLQPYGIRPVRELEWENLWHFKRM
jgi:hypothetical protein